MDYLNIEIRVLENDIKSDADIEKLINNISSYFKNKNNLKIKYKHVNSLTCTPDNKYHIGDLFYDNVDFQYYLLLYMFECSNDENEKYLHLSFCNSRNFEIDNEDDGCIEIEDGIRLDPDNYVGFKWTEDAGLVHYMWNEHVNLDFIQKIDDDKLYQFFRKYIDFDDEKKELKEK